MRAIYEYPWRGFRDRQCGRIVCPLSFIIARQYIAENMENRPFSLLVIILFSWISSYLWCFETRLFGGSTCKLSLSFSQITPSNDVYNRFMNKSSTDRSDRVRITHVAFLQQFLWLIETHIHIRIDDVKTIAIPTLFIVNLWRSRDLNVW